MSRITYVFCALAVLAVVAGGCGGGDDSTAAGSYGSSDGGGAAKSSDNESADSSSEQVVGDGVVGALSVANVGDLGEVLVDRGHHVVYVFHKDNGSTSSCYAACAAKWPPLLTEIEPRAKGGVDAAELDTMERKDGSTQVTYAGQPLYTFAEDIRPLEANGNDVTAFGGEWYALRPSGEEAED